MEDLFIQPINVIQHNDARKDIIFNNNIVIPDFKVIDFKSDKKILFIKNTLSIYLVEPKVVDLLNQFKGHFVNQLPSEYLKLLLYDEAYIGIHNKNDKLNKGLNTDIKIKKIFLHVSHDCNLHCGYCYASGGNYGGKTQLMTLDTAGRAIEFILNLDQRISKLSIEFFGGEPLLNYKTIYSLIDYIESSFSNCEFEYGCVTNATVMNDEIQNMLNKYNFHVMLTIDGPREFHDLQRVFLNGSGSFDIVYSNIPLFKNSVKDLSARIVYSKKNANLFKIFKYIYEELGIKDISFRPVMTDIVEYKLDEESETLTINTLCDCLDYFIERKLSKEKIESRFFSEILLNLIKRNIKDNFCDFGRFVSITPEGDIYPCTHFIYNECYKLGNIFDNFLDNELLNKCIQSGIPNYKPCNECWIVGLCGGGCKGSSVYYNNNIFINDEYCKTREKIVTNSIISIAKLFSQNRLNELTNELERTTRSKAVSPNRWR